MRFRKDSSVEVFSRREVPSGSWFLAKIVSGGNGDYYNVKYYDFSLDVGSTVEKVSKKVIRPCPPRMVASRSWDVGDVVEVFENSSWMPAEIMDVLDGGAHFSVKIRGLLKEIRTRRCNIRSRHTWKFNKWVLINKESEQLEKGKTDLPSKVRYSTRQKLQQHGGVRRRKRGAQVHDKKDEDDTHKVSLRCVKKKGKCQRLRVTHSSKLPAKVHGLASPRTNFGEKCMNWGKPNDGASYFILGRLECNDSDSVQSSVGSCSPSYSQYMSYDCPKASPTEDVNIDFDSEAHQLELNAYRSTMVALYALGPLSWEREALLTNLRLVLHITNDEHLSELRQLRTNQK